MNKLGFIGMGNMGRAIASGLVKAGTIAPEDVCACALHFDKLAEYAKETGISACHTAREVAEKSDTVLLAVKPYVLEGVLRDIRDLLPGKALLSIALGYDHARLSSLVDASTRVQFIMPNTPALVGRGVLLFEEMSSLLPDEKQDITDRFSSLGTIIELSTRLMGIGGALSGCGPAFCAIMIESLADAGVRYGLPRATAYRLASATLEGTGALQLATGTHPGALKDAVCSPGGSTIRGVEALERAGLRAAMLDAVEAVMNYKP